jgi:hypothetical protein
MPTLCQEASLLSLERICSSAATVARVTSALTFSSRDAATLASGLHIKPAFLESRRRSQTGGGFFFMPP